MIKKIESLGRRLGCKEVRFRDPETFFYFQEPHNTIVPEKERVKQIALVRGRMRVFYGKIRQNLGYTKRVGDYWIKEL